MKKIIGLFLSILSIQVSANSTTLLLRGTVPGVVRVDPLLGNQNIKLKITTNFLHKDREPQLKIDERPNHSIVSVKQR